MRADMTMAGPSVIRSQHRSPARTQRGAVAAGLHDAHGRVIEYLRLSLTPSCPMRCVYCRPAGMCGQACDQMTSQEITALVGHLVANHGVRKVRLTGGEPTCRRDLVPIIEQLAALPHPPQLTMTTNGLSLARHATALAAAGLTRVNVSIDSLDPDRFRQITGVDDVERVMGGIDAAIAAGLMPVKLNAVVMRNYNDQDMADLVDFAANRQLEMRFIELMPMGPLADTWGSRYVSEAWMKRCLDRIVETWAPCPADGSAARRYQARLTDGRHVTVGFITPMSCSFCDRCDRIRISADGALYPCLMDKPAGTLMPGLRPLFDPEKVTQILLEGLGRKRIEHPATGVSVMTEIGG